MSAARSGEDFNISDIGPNSGACKDDAVFPGHSSRFRLFNFPVPAVRRELLGADVALPSLDAATQDTFLKINRPHASLRIEDYIPGLAGHRTDIETAILETVSRRPWAGEDMSAILGLHVNGITKYLEALVKNGAITPVRGERGRLCEGSGEPGGERRAGSELPMSRVRMSEGY